MSENTFIFPRPVCPKPWGHLPFDNSRIRLRTSGLCYSLSPILCSPITLTFFLCVLHNHMNNMKYAKTVNSERLWKFIANVTLHVDKTKKIQKSQWLKNKVENGNRRVKSAAFLTSAFSNSPTLILDALCNVKQKNQCTSVWESYICSSSSIKQEAAWLMDDLSASVNSCAGEEIKNVKPVLTDRENAWKKLSSLYQTLLPTC